MADISKELNAISGARYGEEVRGSIVSAISKINDVVNDSEPSDLVNISTPFITKIYKNEKIIGYNTSDTSGFDSLKMASNNKFISVVSPVSFSVGSPYYTNYISFQCDSSLGDTSQIILFDKDKKVITNILMHVGSNNKVDINLNSFSSPTFNHNLIKTRYVAFSTTGSLDTIEYHNVLDPDQLNHRIINSNPFVKDIKLHKFIYAYDQNTKQPIYSHDPYFWNYNTLTIPVKPNGTSIIRFSYHYDGRIPGVLENGMAQVLFLDSDKNVFYNTTYARSNDQVTIEFYNAKQISASYVMFSTDQDPNAIEYHNVLDSDPLNHDELLVDFTMFRNMACLGDSYMQGSICKPDGTYLSADYSNPWPDLIGRRFGIDVKNYGHGGSMTKTYWENNLDSVLSEDPVDCYFYCWGLNDTSTDGLHTKLWNNLSPADRIGQASDIVTSESQTPANTVYGYYSSIIAKIKSHAPKARHIIIGIPRWDWNSNRDKFNVAAKNIADHFGIPFIDPRDDPFFSSEVYTSMNGGHPTRAGYSGMARAMTRLFDKCVTNNVSYFKDVVVD